MGDQKKIIVVDDEVRICQSFQRALGKAGYDVETFEDGASALERLEAGGVDLVVSDLMMPDKTGADILRDMQAAGIVTPLVMITGYASTENALETMRLGAIDYLPKPFTVDELKSVVARALRAGEIDASQLPSAPEGTHEIRGHSWIRRLGDDRVAIGVHPFVLACCGAVTEVELPMEEDELKQGGACGKLVAEDSRVPVRLWSPVSGNVKATNPRIERDPSTIAADPYGDGWLIEVQPEDLERDLSELVPSGQ